MEKDDKLLTYTLSLGFVVLILVFLIAILQISKFVLEDTNPIGEHVISTKNLFENIEEVEKSVVKSKQPEESIDTFNIEDLKCNNYNNDVKYISYINIRDNRSIISLELDLPINVINETYYIKSENIDDLKIGNQIIINNNDNYLIVQIIKIQDNMIEVVDFKEKTQFEIVYKDVLGKVIVNK